MDNEVSSLVSSHDLGILQVSPALIEDFFKNDVFNVIEKRELVSADLVRPPADILVPSLEALRYSRARPAFAGLIATAMDKHNCDFVLPAHVEIIKQLSMDEFSILAAMPEPSRVCPAVDIIYQFSRQRRAIACKYVIPSALSEACKTKKNIPQYFENLQRLCLVEVHRDRTTDRAAFQELGQQDFVRKLIQTAPRGTTPSVAKYVINLTEMGYFLQQACRPA